MTDLTGVLGRKTREFVAEEMAGFEAWYASLDLPSQIAVSERIAGALVRHLQTHPQALSPVLREIVLEETRLKHPLILPGPQ